MTEIKNLRLGVIGFGNMASAIVDGFLSDNIVKKENIYVCASNYHRLEERSEKRGINPCKTAFEVVENADMVIVAVKPYMVRSVMEPLKDNLKNKIVVSVAAGIYLKDFNTYMTEHVQIICTVPNLALSVREGIVICEKSHSLKEESLSLFEELFGKLGILEFLDTKYMNVGATVAGCSPAFVAMFMEALADAGVKHGISRESSYKIAAKVVAGTGKLQMNSDSNPADIKDRVCSPGGTTIKGVASLEKDGFRGAIISAVDEICE